MVMVKGRSNGGKFKVMVDQLEYSPIIDIQFPSRFFDFIKTK